MDSRCCSILIGWTAFSVFRKAGGARLKSDSLDGNDRPFYPNWMDVLLIGCSWSAKRGESLDGDTPANPS